MAEPTAPSDATTSAIIDIQNQQINESNLEASCRFIGTLMFQVATIHHKAQLFPSTGAMSNNPTVLGTMLVRDANDSAPSALSPNTIIMRYNRIVQESGLIHKVVGNTLQSEQHLRKMLLMRMGKLVDWLADVDADELEHFVDKLRDEILTGYTNTQTALMEFESERMAKDFVDGQLGGLRKIVKG